jgi:hypothetical protein
MYDTNADDSRTSPINEIFDAFKPSTSFPHLKFSDARPVTSLSARESLVSQFNACS